MKIKFSYLLTILTVIFIVLLHQNMLKPLDLKLQDSWYQDGRAVDSRIVILAIDDKSLGDVGQWPWKRDVHAELVEKLNQGSPAVIGFDITFPLPSENDRDDQSFIEAVEKSDNVILARYGVFDRYASAGIIKSAEISEPFTALKEAAFGLGHLNTLPDTDGVVRNALYEFEFNGERIESFSAVIAKEYAKKMGMQIDIDETVLNPYRQFHIDYAGEPGDFEVIPYSMVLNGEVDPAYMTNKIVLIGPYTVGIKDDFYTPMSSKRTMYGVEIHANIIQNILEDNYKKEIDWYWNALILCIIGILIYFIFRVKSIILSLIFTVLVAGIGLFIGKILYQQGWILSLIYLLLLLGISYIMAVAYNYIVEQSERKRVTTIFGRYVAPQVVSQILENGEEGLKLGGSRKEVTVIFVDIRGFTTLSESVEPEEIVAILNEYLNLTANCIFEFGGTLDKFIGDATMAIFNAPLSLENHELQAVKSAFAMKTGAIALEKMLQERFGKSVKFGIGIHTGPAVVGNIGSATRMDYTVIGDTVNTAARLESNAKPGQIIMSEQVYEKVKEDVVASSLGEIYVKGKVNGVLIYELEDLK